MTTQPNAAGVPQIFQATDNLTGLPLAGGQLFTWAAGTTTLQDTYADPLLTTPMPNPIILDNYGQAVFYLNPALGYRYNLLNVNNVQQAHYPQDNISPLGAGNVGTQVTAANTITPTGTIFHVTGATVIKTINLPYAGFVGSITLIPDSAFTTDATGNIAVASVGVVNTALVMTFDGTKWYPSY